MEDLYMPESSVRVSIALPVYNGEQYIKEALDSILNQTYKNFELIISDNASTDGTEAICREYAAKDARIRYFRQDENIGSGPNFHFAWEQSEGEYFKWSAHDDVIAPKFLETCIDALDKNPDAVLCYPRVKVIDKDSKYVEDHDIETQTRDENPIKRFSSLMLAKGHRCNEVFGLIRQSELIHTEGIGNYAVSDRILLAQLALRGPFYEHPDRLFYNRRHMGQFSHTIKTQHQSTVWWDTTQIGKIVFPEWRAFNGYRRSLNNSPVGFLDKCLGRLYLLQYIRRYRHRMMNDVKVAIMTWWNRRFNKKEKQS